MLAIFNASQKRPTFAKALFLQASLPNLMGVFGMLIACVGLVAFVRHEHD